MRVLLISPNRERLPDPVFPLGLAYIGSAARGAGHDVRAVDLCFADDAGASVTRAIREFSPELVGLSIRNVDDVSYPKNTSYLADCRDVVDSVRACTGAPVVVGGSGFTLLPDLFMEALDADYGIAGEGESAFPALLEALARAGSIKRPASPLVIRSRSRLQDMDRHLPDRGLFDGDAYYESGGMLNIQTKRGCPFSCIYCTYPRIEGRRVRLRSPRSVADEIEAVVGTSGVRHFFIVDSIFNFPEDHALAVCKEIENRRLDVKWSCYAHPAYMTGAMARAMAAAGCSGVEFGIDSLSEGVLLRLGKNFTCETVERASAACRTAGIRFCHFVFVGAPGDDMETVKKTFERLDRIDPDVAVIMAGIRIFPGTVLAETARLDLGIAGPGLEPVFYLSGNVAQRLDEIAGLVLERRNWVMPGMEININRRLQKRVRERGIRGSLWEELSKRTR